LVGSIAGDDTVLVVARDAAGGAALAARLHALADRNPSAHPTTEEQSG